MLAGEDQRPWLLLAFDGGDGPSQAIARAASADEALADTLARLAPELGALERLRLIPTGALVNVDIQRALLERLGPRAPSLRYSLGLGRPPERRAAPGDAAVSTSAEDLAAVIAGAEDLAAVAEEVRATTARLRALGWRVEDSWSPASERQPALLHYAGHGRYAREQGGWRSALELPGYGRLEAADIVANGRAPALVVLAACSAGRADPQAIDGGMNLAAAFLLAGAELVIAPTRDVDDRATLALSRALYGQARLDATSLTEALDAAQREELAHPELPRAPATSATSWRAWTP
nr:CHAT domain-containing protein [Pseudenhygromyxa sp. WMMC2535]